MWKTLWKMWTTLVQSGKGGGHNDFFQLWEN
jgi:hypothetical protein